MGSSRTPQLMADENGIEIKVEHRSEQRVFERGKQNTLLHVPLQSRKAVNILIHSWF